MVTLATVQDVLDRCGLNANAVVIASQSIVERYITTSEGVVISETKIDWITGIANVDTYVKEELTSCVASHAAKQIVNFDMRGFGTRAEAVTVLNVNQEEFLRSLKALKDLDTNKLRDVPSST